MRNHLIVAAEDTMVSANQFGVDVILIEDSQDNVIDSQDDISMSELRCATCGERFESADLFSTHNSERKCTAIEIICHVCMKIVKGHTKFLDHVRRHNEDESGTTSQSEETMTLDESDDVQANGIVGSAVDEEPKCPFCREDIGHDPIQVEKHLEIHAIADPTDKLYPCVICPKSFKARGDLRRHMVRHVNIKPFRCTECAKTFATKNELIRHNRSHTGESPYVCEMCNTSFTTSSSLTKHRNRHTGNSRFICHICNKKYFDSYALNRHIMMHTGERPYRCDICNRGFCQRGDMTVHMRTHTNDRPFKCPICFVAFKQSSNRNAHMRRHALAGK